MAKINAIEMRDEVDRVKQEFEQLCASGKVTPEIKAVVDSLLIVVALIMAIFMERKTPKNSKNSSIPPSQTDADDTSTGKPRRKGKGKKVDGEISNTRVRKSVTLLDVTSCGSCGDALDDVPCSGVERRTRIDIIFEKVVDHYDAEIKQCPNCGAQTKGQFPDNMPGNLQYGNGLKAFIIHLIISQMVALNRVQKQVQAMIGEVLSEASLLKFVLRLHQALETWENQAIETILRSPTTNVDETSYKVEKEKYWIHVYSAGGTTLKLLHRKRGREAIEELNIIPRYFGVIIHDCWGSYLSYKHCGHGLCGSHLLRELTFIFESNQYRWAKNIKRLLKDTCRIVASRESKCLTAKEYANLQKRYRNILTRGSKELPELPPRPKGKRGKMAQSDAQNLWDRLKKYEASVLLFAKVGHVPFTNNRAERDLRMAKVKQKVSGCFRKKQYAEAYCRISSYLQTMASQGINPLVAIQMALEGKFPAPEAGGE